MFTPSSSAILSFEREFLPDYIVLFGLRVPVHQYYPDPMQCKSCYEYGHTTKRCPSSAIKLCGWCSKPQHNPPGTKCESDAKCKNCTVENLENDHSNFNHKCQIYIRQHRIAELREVNKIPFWEAAEMVKGSRKTKSMAKNVYENASNSNETTNQTCNQSIEENNKMWETRLAQLSENLNNQMTNLIDTISNQVMAKLSDQISNLVVKQIYNLVPMSVPPYQQANISPVDMPCPAGLSLSDLVKSQQSGLTKSARNYIHQMENYSETSSTEPENRQAKKPRKSQREDEKPPDD